MRVETLQSSRQRIATIVRGIFEGLGEGRSVPPPLIDAVVDGRGDRAAVQRACRAAYGPEKPFNLVLFDTDRIADYVFESSRPPVIAGASLLLRELNAQIGADFGKWAVFSGGGEGLLLVPRGRGAEICAAIRERFRRQTAGALSVTAVWLPASPDEFIFQRSENEAAEGTRLVSGTQAVLCRLRDQARREKDEKPALRPSVPGGEERCASCRDRKEEGFQIPREDEIGRLCTPCWKRWQEGRRLISGVSFDDLVERLTTAYPGLGAKARYLGFLYVDGNAMGNLFGRLEALPQIACVSRAVSAVFEQVEARTGQEVERLVPNVDTIDRLFLSYLGGGDEAIWILPAALAVEVAGKLPGWIDDEARAIGGELPRITAGAGLVLCQTGYPVRYQYGLAKALLKSAKGMFHGARPEEVRSSLDFELLTDSSPLSEEPEVARAIAWSTEEEDFWRTCRPYRADGFRTLLDRLRTARESVATSQLYALRAGAGEGRKVFLNYLRYQIARGLDSYGPWLGRCGQDVADAAGLERFFITEAEGKSGTWLPDGLQLLPFLDQLAKLEEAR
jgi:hypothetical protein